MTLTPSEAMMIRKAEAFAKEELERESSGHDWSHTDRVRRTAVTIAKEEKANVYICELAALLHDVGDAKLNPSKEEGILKVRQWLERNEATLGDTEHVIRIVSTMSYAGGGGQPMDTPEGRIVQDADRLDAIGAVGVARVFAYSGAKGRLFHDPDLPPRTAMTEEEYRSGKDTAINHFYEKLLKLKDLMNTSYGRKLAEGRHRFMLDYLDRFYKEWDGVQ